MKITRVMTDQPSTVDLLIEALHHAPSGIIEAVQRVNKPRFQPSISHAIAQHVLAIPGWKFPGITLTALTKKFTKNIIRQAKKRVPIAIVGRPHAPSRVQKIVMVDKDNPEHKQYVIAAIRRDRMIVSTKEDNILNQMQTLVLHSGLTAKELRDGLNRADQGENIKLSSIKQLELGNKFLEDNVYPLMNRSQQRRLTS